jgi:hypothetical protein
MNIKGYQTLHQMQIKVKQWRFYCCYTSYSHNSVFNNEHTKSYPKMIVPPPPPPAVERYSLQYLCRQTSPPGIPTVLICMPHGSSTRKQNTGECNPTPQSLGSHRNHWVRHHTMRQQTPQSLGPTPHHEGTNTQQTPHSLGPTPHHEATNTAITGSDTTP